MTPNPYAPPACEGAAENWAFLSEAMPIAADPGGVR